MNTPGALYLSSNDIPDVPALHALLKNRPDATKVALVMNARDSYDPAVRLERTEKVTGVLKKAGFTHINQLDLREYSNQPLDLKKLLSAYGFIWVAGGNSFVLRRAIRTSGLEQILPELLANGLVYGGESAGAAITGPTLRGVELADDPADVKGEVIWDGLDLACEVVIPHSGSVRYGHLIEQISSTVQSAGYPTRLLGDADFVVYKG